MYVVIRIEMMSWAVMASRDGEGARGFLRAPCMNNLHVGSAVGQVMDLPSSGQHGEK